MSDASGVGGARGSARADSGRASEDEPPEWPDDDQGLSLDEGPARAEADGSTDRRPSAAAPTADVEGMSAAPVDDVRGMSYEQARDALVAVVDRLERGGTTLEESLALWERGEALAARCEAWLTGARARLEAARAGAQARSPR